MDLDTLSTLIIVIGFGLFFGFAVVREWYLDYTDDKALEAYRKKVYTEMHK